MILFVPDACAIARVYFKDIGTRNMRQIYTYPQSQMIVPNIALCEVLSTLISAYNNHVLDERQYRASRAVFEGDLKIGKIRSFNVIPAVIKLARDLICKHKIQPGRRASQCHPTLARAVARFVLSVSMIYVLQDIKLLSSRQGGRAVVEQYSAAVIDHFLNPRNVGDLPDAHGVGMASNPHDGDTVRFSIRVEDGVIEAARFKAQGCVAAIAGSSALTELVQGKDLEEALAITKGDLAAALDGLSERKQACSLTCLEALRLAVEQCDPNLAK